MTAKDRVAIHFTSRPWRIWTPCGIRLRLVHATGNADEVTCPKCITHIKKVETPRA